MPSTSPDALAVELQALRVEVKELRNDVRDSKVQPRDRARIVCSSWSQSRSRYVEAVVLLPHQRRSSLQDVGTTVLPGRKRGKRSPSMDDSSPIVKPKVTPRC